MHNPPTGTVTFLFTDIEGSTKLWEAHPSAMKEGGCGGMTRASEVKSNIMHSLDNWVRQG